MPRSELIPYWSRMDRTGPYFVHVQKMVPYRSRQELRQRHGRRAGEMPEVCGGLTYRGRAAGMIAEML